ncbi:MAG: DNA mismatch endonuclease Vsr [Candidatus Omnitrophica bacterium]|nr:DNA mismatch endonuclease Vsr [Candidatus Omnitrophota bacterium]
MYNSRKERKKSLDPLTAEERGRQMSLVRSKDTKPEMRVRRLVHSMGYRYRLHRRDLPGCPDLVFPTRKKVIFVHGCFWHRHKGCPRARLPKSRVEFWEEKLSSNVARDRKARRRLKRLGWDVLVIWECESEKPEKVKAKVKKFLEESS